MKLNANNYVQFTKLQYLLDGAQALGEFWAGARAWNDALTVMILERVILILSALRPGL